MIIKEKKYIRNLSKIKNFLKEGQSFYVGINDLSSYKTKLIEIGFTSNLEEGEKVLPKAIGKYTLRNSEGYFIIRKDLEKETAYRQGEWRWNQWAGRGIVEEHYRIVDIPYYRYPRERVLPYSEQLEIANQKNEKIILTRELVFNKEHENLIIHIINMFLECFGKCQILNSNLHPIIKSKEKLLNWEILPPGKHPWEKVRTDIEKINRNIPKGVQPIINKRLELITTFEPDLLAYGKNGFNGYYIFGFTKNDIYILESNKRYNATYILGKQWEELSKLTKAELLSDNLHKERFIHKSDWEKNIKNLFK